jgi:hypothetical protein
MGYSKPIWNDVTSCGYSKPPSWGGQNHVTQTTYVGSGPQNSEQLAELSISRKFYDRFVVFNYAVDGRLLSQAIFLINNTRAGCFIEKRTKNFINHSNQHTHPANRKADKLTKTKK